MRTRAWRLVLPATWVLVSGRVLAGPVDAGAQDPWESRPSVLQYEDFGKFTETIQDRWAKLEWQRRTGPPVAFHEAQVTCEELELGGHDD